ncbi:Hypothetical predicted protein [Olea europaea subsp. europaea]|uniref:Uncharacterized protein n=1 Tax=Olea europaea subsp. europaea TaxID=158383 RepID=A0A8S0T4Y0_OLEEU|nr:Hypothetical predicted protein [Olea europaea subsp. europaea]
MHRKSNGASPLQQLHPCTSLLFAAAITHRTVLRYIIASVGRGERGVESMPTGGNGGVTAKKTEVGLPIVRNGDEDLKWWAEEQDEDEDDDGDTEKDADLGASLKAASISQMESAVDALFRELAKLRTGMASAGQIISCRVVIVLMHLLITVNSPAGSNMPYCF